MPVDSDEKASVCLKDTYLAC